MNYHMDLEHHLREARKLNRFGSVASLTRKGVGNDMATKQAKAAKPTKKAKPAKKAAAKKVAPAKKAAAKKTTPAKKAATTKKS